MDDLAPLPRHAATGKNRAGSAGNSGTPEALSNDHPCKGMSKVQIDTFEQVAVGVTLPPATKRTWNALEKRGVIVRGSDLVRRDALGGYRLPQWHVPIHVHAQWCAWCSENVADEEGQSDG